mmetsp:Transcript_26138/g.70762  ORF Transcript_26138/g.70762 Transcript_26138/m.70762 type:complete len:238 (+) Transcript_26138:46-759(+)
MLPSKHQVLDFPPGNRNKKEVSVLNRATMPRDDDAPPGTEGSEFKAFIGGLSYAINSEDLQRHFERYDATRAEVMMDKHTNRPRGFGFVFFKDEGGLKDAIRDMHEKEIEGRRISVVRAVPQDQTRPGTPAAALGAGAGARRDFGRRDYSRYDRGYDRYDRDPLPPRSYGGYDPRYAYDRGYDRYAGYGAYGGYAAYPDDRVDSYAYSRYDDRSSGGPDRRSYSASRPAPYDRPPRR